MHTQAILLAEFKVFLCKNVGWYLPLKFKPNIMAGIFQTHLPITIIIVMIKKRKVDCDVHVA